MAAELYHGGTVRLSGFCQILRQRGIVNFVGNKASVIVRQYNPEFHAAIWTHVSCRHTRKASARALRY